MDRQGGQNDNLESDPEAGNLPTNSPGESSGIAPEYEAVFEQAPDGIIVHDSDGQILDINETVSEKLGYTREELLSMAVTEIEVGLDEELLREKWQSMDTGSMKRLEVEGIHRRKDGSTFPVEVWVSRLEMEKTETDRFVALARDITERKERERELERYEHLWRNLPVGVCRIDPAGDGEFIEVNETLVDILGAGSREELLQQPVAELWEEESQREALVEQVDEMDRETIERRFETLDGRTVWLRTIVMPRKEGTYVDVVAQDITDRRQQEIHLEKAQEVGNIGWWRKDIPSDEIYWSEQIYDMWGAEGEVGLIDHETFLEFIHPEDREEVDQAWETAKEGELYDIEHRIVTGDGETRWMQEKAELTFDKEGDPIHAVGVVQDITERKKRELELEQTKALVESAGDVLWMFDTDFSETLVINDAYEEILGQPTEELEEEATAFLEAVHPDDRERLQRGMEQLQEGETIDFELRVNPREDFGRWLWVKGAPVYEDGAPLGFSGFARDVTERHEREQELERHRTYVESVTDVITLIDPDGTIEYVSPAIEHVFGWDRTELIGENGFEYVHPDDREPRISDVEELAESSGAKTTFEFRFQNSDGSYVWVEATAQNLLEEPDIEGILLSSRDIDERKVHEERLSTLHETTRRVVDAETKAEIAEIAVEAASDLLEFSLPSVWYPSDDDSELALVANSAEHQELLEKAETPDPTHPRDGWYWDVFEDDETVVKSPIPQEQLAADVPLQSAIILPMGPHGVLACAARGEVEFTDRQIRAAEILARNVRVALDQVDQRTALERQKAFTDNLLDAIEDVVYVLDSEGDFIDWNAAFEEVTEYTSEELESMNALDFFKEEDTKAAAAAIEESFETGRTRVELDLLTADGESIPYEFTANAFKNPDDEPVVAGIGRDRSRHVEYEQTLEEQRDNLSILNQVVRHDIRNNMTVVRGRANLLAEHVEEAGKEDLEAVQDATESAIELTKTARDLSETMLSTEEDVKPVRLDHHLQTPIENARSEFDDAIIITDNRLPNVRVRGNDLLEAVFRNLIQNAIIHNDKENPEVRISVTLNEETATVAVADNGPGIPDDQKEAIFGKGEKGLDSPGTGLGLYLVQTLVEQYGGDVWVEDNDPEGSVFYVELPQIEEDESR